LGIAILIKGAVDTGPTIFRRNTGTAGQIGRITDFALFTILIAEAGGTGLAYAKAVTVLANTTGVIRTTAAKIVGGITKESSRAFRIGDAVDRRFFRFTAGDG